MRRAGAGLIVAVLALAGCKSADSKSGDDKSPGGAVGRSRKDRDKDKDGTTGKGPTWLDDVARLPGAGTDIPRGTGTIAKDPKVAAQEELSGRVLDPFGRPARNIIIRVVEVGAAPSAFPFETAVYTNNEGYFRSPGKPGKTYELTAEASLDGQKLVGVVQTKVPSSTLTIQLREDLAAAGGTFPPAPKPSDKVNDNITAPGVAPKAPADGAWVPGGPSSGTPPATIGGSAGGAGAPKPGNGQLPPPDDSLFPGSPKAVKPENVAEGKDPFRPPTATIPGPGAGPPVPALPPLMNPPGGGRSSMGGAGPGKITLVDVLDRPWDLDSVKFGTLALVEFMDTTSEPCREYLPVLKDLQSRYGGSGLQVVGVVCDNVPQKDRSAIAAKYGRDNHLNYALYVEPGTAGSVRDRFRVERYPYAVLLDSTGRMLWSGHPGDRAPLEAAIKQNLGK
jgi:thiol-disulfide isomerase/thioredoxin